MRKGTFIALNRYINPRGIRTGILLHTYPPIPQLKQNDYSDMWERFRDQEFYATTTRKRPSQSS
jgi:hypothetical protein